MKVLILIILFIGVCVQSSVIKDVVDITTDSAITVSFNPVSMVTGTAPTIGPMTEQTVSAATIPPASAATDTAPTIHPISTGTNPIITFIPVESTTSSAPTVGPAAITTCGFDGASFGGGLALGIGLCLIALVAYKCYASRKSSATSSVMTTTNSSYTTVEPGTSVSSGSAGTTMPNTGTSVGPTTETPKTSMSPSPSPSSKAPTTKPSSTKFDGGSFGGGIALGFGLAIILIIAYRCYILRHTSNGKGYSNVE